MNRLIYRGASFCMALLIAMSFIPLLGVQEVYAKAVDTGTVTIDLNSGLDSLRGDKMHASVNVLESMADLGIIHAGENAYDLDKDGTMDITFEHRTADKYGPETEWYSLSKTTSIEGKTWSIDVPRLVRLALRLRNMEYCSKVEIEFPTLIRELNIDIKAPACGTETNTPKGEYDLWEYEQQTNKPEVKLTDEDSWLWLDDIYSFWVSGAENNAPYIGMFKGGESYWVDIEIFTEQGYHVVEDVKVNINGFEIKDIDVSSLYTCIVGTINASVDSHIPGSPEITPPTLDAAGSKIYRCKGCGSILSSETISNDAIREAYAKGDAAGRSAAEEAIRQAYAEGTAAGKSAAEMAAAERIAGLTPGKAVINKVKTGSKKATVTWKTVKKATGYEICLTNTKTGKVNRFTVKQSAKQAAKKTISRTIKNLKKGKYKVKVRAINEVNGEIFCGSWSKTKALKIK